MLGSKLIDHPSYITSILTEIRNSGGEVVVDGCYKTND